MALDIWMRENPLTYVWLGSYLFALAVFVVEIVLVMHKRKITLKQIRLLRDAGPDEGEE